MTVQDILKTDGVITATADEKLGAVLSNLSSSHDAAFIFGSHDQFLGIINPYYGMVKTSYPSHTKVESCVFHPPKLALTDSLERAAALMIESKIYYLPVFEREKFVGIVTAGRILQKLSSLPPFIQSIASVLATKPPLVSIYDDDTLAHARSMFKDFKISKLVVIGRAMKLKGVISYFDLIDHLSEPLSRPEKGSRVGEKTRAGNQAVKRFAKTHVLTLSGKDPLRKAVELTNSEEIGSVIIIDLARHPVGIITTKDLLSQIAEKKKTLPFIFEPVHLVGTIRDSAEVVAKRIAQKVGERSDIFQAVLRVEQEQSGKEPQDDYTASLHIRHCSKNKDPKIITKKGRTIDTVLRDLKTAVYDYLGRR